MKSKTKIDMQLRNKTNPTLVETIMAAKKNDAWVEVGGKLSTSRKNRKSVNLKEINEQSKEGETIIIPGKVLSMGELNKKIKIAALDFSENAKEKIAESGSKVLPILEEIKNNPEAKGIRILSKGENRK